MTSSSIENMESRIIENCFRRLLHSLQQKKGSVDKSKSWQQQCAMPLLATSPRNEAKMMGLQNVVQTSELCQMSGGGKHIKKVFYFVLSKRKLLMENQIFFFKEGWSMVKGHPTLPAIVHLFFSNLLFNSNSKWIIGVQTFKK